MSRRWSPGCLEPAPLSPKPVYGGGDREGLGPEESVRVPGALVSAWGRRGGPPPHSFSLTFPLVGTPARRPPAARCRLGCSTLVLRPPPSGDQSPWLLRHCCLCLVPVSQAHGDLHRWGAGGAPPSCACWLPWGAGMQTPGEVKGSHGAPSPAQCGLAWHAHPERGLQPGAGGPGSVHVTRAVVPPWPLWAPARDGASTQTSILMWFVLGRLLFSGFVCLKMLWKNSNPSAGPEDRLLSGRGWGQGPESRLSQHARPCPVPTGGAPATDLEQVGPATPPPRDVTPSGPCASV